MSKSLGFSNMYASSQNKSSENNNLSYDDLINSIYNNRKNELGLQIQNLSPNTLSYMVSNNPNYISDEDLYKRMWHNINEYENIVPYPYLDTKGYITTGGGANIDNYDDFMKVNFTVGDIPATDEQKTTAYKNLRKLSEEKDVYGNYLYAKKKANFFKDKTNLQLSDQDAYNMAQNHMSNDLAHVRKEFTNFDNFPNPLKEVLLDIQYNVIGGLNRKDWPNLYNAIDNYDVNGIYNNVNRKDVQQSRNDWTKRMVKSIRF